MLSWVNAFDEQSMRARFWIARARGLDLPAGDLFGGGAEVEYCLRAQLDGLRSALLL